MKKAMVFLASGFEEMEAMGVVDILRRGGIEAETVSITGERVVTGAHNIPVTADTTLENATLDGAAALILPGGLPARPTWIVPNRSRKHCSGNIAKAASLPRSAPLRWYWADWGC